MLKNFKLLTIVHKISDWEKKVLIISFQFKRESLAELKREVKVAKDETFAAFELATGSFLSYWLVHSALYWRPMPLQFSSKPFVSSKFLIVCNEIFKSKLMENLAWKTICANVNTSSMTAAEWLYWLYSIYIDIMINECVYSIWMIITF